MRARATILCVLTLAGMARAQADSVPPVALRYRVTVGAHLGLVHLVGAQATSTFFAEGRPRFDVDLLWEPSAALQSYSVGGAYHLLDSVAFLGLRARWLQWHFPGSTAYDARADNDFGLGFEGGVRAPIAFQRRLLFTATVGATGVPTTGRPLQWLLNVNLGFAWAALQR